MKSEITWPPIEYLFFENEQPSAEAWSSIAAFAAAWNKDHESKFVTGESEEWSVDLAKGIKDPEYNTLDRELHQLRKEYGLNWFLGLVDRRKPSDFEKAPFVQITGNTYPLEFIVNHTTLFGPVIPCRECGARDETNRQLLQTPVADESFLEKQVHPSPDYTPPGLDMVTLENGLLIVSKKVKELLSKNKAGGYELLPVISQQSGQPSQNLFLLRAKRSILKPCNFHTPVTEEGICSTCGRIKGGLLNYYYIREEWMEGDEIISRHPLRYDSIYLSNRIYHVLKNQVKGMLPADGIFACRHTEKK